jgi:hypothetical protein
MTTIATIIARPKSPPPRAVDHRAPVVAAAGMRPPSAGCRPATISIPRLLPG